jgi:hypothetical protein
MQSFPHHLRSRESPARPSVIFNSKRVSAYCFGRFQDFYFRARLVLTILNLPCL